jgi:hypothetical protein
MWSPFFLSACVSSLIIFEPISRCLWNSRGMSCHLRWPRRHNSSSRNSIHSKIDVQTSEVNAKLSPSCTGQWHFVCRQNFKWWTTFNKTTFAKKNQEYECAGRLKVKTHILFCRHDSRNVAVGKMKLGTVKYHRHTYKLYLNHYFVW